MELSACLSKALLGRDHRPFLDLPAMAALALQSRGQAGVTEPEMFTVGAFTAVFVGPESVLPHVLVTVHFRCYVVFRCEDTRFTYPSLIGTWGCPSLGLLRRALP